SFLRLLVRMRGALDSEALDAGGQRDGAGDACAGALDGVRYFPGRLVYDPEVIGLEANSNTLSHTKNNCLLMVVKSAFELLKAEADTIIPASGCNIFFKNFSVAFPSSTRQPV